MSLEAQTRKILAEYSGMIEGDDGLPWAEHLLKAQEPQLGVENATKKIEDAEAPEGTPHIHDDSVGKALIDDIHGGLSIPREVSGPLVSEPEGGDRSWEPVTHFNTPQRYTEDVATKNWWDSREREDNATGTAFGKEYLGIPLEASVAMPMDAYFGFRKEAKTMSQILQGNLNHKQNVMIERGTDLIPLYSAALSQLPKDETSKGLFLLSVTSPDSGETHRTVVQFLKGKDPQQDFVKRDCLVGCDCDAFLYWGAQYYAVKGGYLHNDFLRPTLVAPKDYIPGVTKTMARGKQGTYCKHLFAAMHALMRTKPEAPTDLADDLIHIKEPLYDAAKMFDVMDIDSYETFVAAIEKGSVPPVLKDEVRKLLEPRDGFASFNEWVGDWVTTGALPYKSRFLNDEAQAPSLIMWVLIQDFRKNGYIADIVLEKAWASISKVLPKKDAQPAPAEGAE